MGRPLPADRGVGAGRRRPGDDVVGATVERQRSAGRVRDDGRRRHQAGGDRAAARAGAGSKAPVQRLVDRVSSVFVPIVLAIAAATFAGWLAFDRRHAGRRDAARGGRAAHRVPVRARARDAGRDHGRHGPGSRARGALQGRRGVRGRPGRRHRAARQDGHGHRGRDAPRRGGAGRRRRAATRCSPSPPRRRPGSEHPIALAVLDAARERGVAVAAPAPSTWSSPAPAPGAVVDGVEMRVGRPDALPPALMPRRSPALASKGRSPFAVWRDGRPVGVIAVSDRVKPEAAEAVARLRAMGMQVALVTGDRRATAEAVAAEAGIDRVSAEVFPDGKVDGGGAPAGCGPSGGLRRRWAERRARPGGGRRRGGDGRRHRRGAGRGRGQPARRVALVGRRSRSTWRVARTASSPRTSSGPSSTTW